MKCVLIVLLALALAGPSFAGEEAEFTKNVLGPKYGADTGTVLHDGTTADILTERFVAAVSFTYKWPDAVGRALHGYVLTGCAPVVVLLREDCESEAERLNILRCKSLCRKLGITCIVEDYQAPGDRKKPTPADPPKRDPRKM